MPSCVLVMNCFCAVEDPAVAVAPGARASQVGDVAAALRLGEREPAAQPRRRQRRQPASLLRVGAELAHDVADDAVRAEHAGQRHPAARQLLEDARVGLVVEAEPVEFRRHAHAEEAELDHARDERVRIFVGVLERARRRTHLALDEAADRVDQKIHG